MGPPKASGRKQAYFSPLAPVESGVVSFMDSSGLRQEGEHPGKGAGSLGRPLVTSLWKLFFFSCVQRSKGTLSSRVEERQKSSPVAGTPPKPNPWSPRQMVEDIWNLERRQCPAPIPMPASQGPHEGLNHLAKGQGSQPSQRLHPSQESGAILRKEPGRGEGQATYPWDQGGRGAPRRP